MAEEPELRTKLTVDTQNLIDGMKHGHEAMEQAVNGMKGNLSDLSSAFTELGPSLLALGGIALMFEGIAEAVKFAAECFHMFIESTEVMHKLAYETGESYAALNEYSLAMNMIGGNLQQMESWMKGATRAQKMNTEAIIANGGEAMKSAIEGGKFIDYLKAVVEEGDKFAPGVERNKWLLTTMGRAGMQAGPELKRFVEVLEEAREVGAEFGMVIGVDDVKAMEELEKGQGKLQFAWKMMQVTIGRELLPVVQQLVSFLVEYLPPAIAYFKEKLLEIYAVGVTLGVGMFIMETIGQACWETLGEAANTYWEILKNPFNVVALHEELAKKIVGIWKVANAATWAAGVAGEALVGMKMAQLQGGKAAEDEKGGTKKLKVKGDDQKESDAVKKEFEEYKKSLILQDAWSLEAEAQFWTRKARLWEGGAKTKTMIEEQAQKFVLQLQARAYEDEKGVIEAEMKDAHTTSARKLELAKQLSELSTKYYNVAHKDQQKLNQQRLAEEQKVADEILKINEMNAAKLQERRRADLALAEQSLKHREAMGELTVDEVYTSELRLARNKADLDREDAERKANLNKNEAAGKAELAKDLEKIDGELALRTREIENKRAEESRAKWIELGNTIKAAFNNVIAGLMNGTMTWSQAFKTLLRSISEAFVKMGVDMVVNWASAMLKKWIMTTFFTAKETITETAANTAKIIQGVAANETLAWSAAALAAVNAMASVAAIPFWGWAAAPGVGAETYATAGGFAALASAAGGWDSVQGDQFAKIHDKEMVMSAPLAEGLRAMIAGGGGRAGDTYVAQVNAIDGPSVQKFVRDHGPTLFDGMKKQARNFRGK